MSFEYIKENVKLAREHIIQTANSANIAEPPTIIAAIKSANTQEINYLVDVCGIYDVGENRVQQLVERYDNIKRDNLRIHFIGKLQRNKVKYIIDKVYMIHSLDNLALAAEINKQASKINKIMNVLIEINIGEEENKSGVLPNEAQQLALELSQFENIKLCGFMTMAPKCDNKSDYIKYFSQTTKIALDIWGKTLHNICVPILSMGMSGSYIEATQCGATYVRIGRNLFENKIKE